MEKEFTTDKVISQIYSESVGEYSLPDYHTDIKKILLTKARAVPAGKFVSDGSVELTGAVNYDIVYLDSENRVTGCSFASDYEIALRCPSEGVTEVSGDTRVTNFSVRAAGPRRFTTKAALLSTVHLLEEGEYTPTGDCIEGAEKLTRTARVRTARFKEGDKISVKETVARIEGVIIDECEVIVASCEPRVISYSRSDGAVDFQGEATVLALVGIGKEQPVTYKKSIPVSGSIPYGEDTLPAASFVTLNVGAVTVTSEAEEDGVELVAEVSLDARLSIYGNTEVDLITDLYRTDVPVENDCSDFLYREHLGAARVNLTHSTQIERTQEGSENLRNFIITSAEPRVEECKVVDDGVEVKGEIKFSGVACEVLADGSLGYTGTRYVAPFVENVNIGCQIPSGATVTCNAECRDADITLDGARIYLDSRLQLDLDVDVERRVTAVVSSSVSGEPFEKDGSVVTVTFPKEGESLFSIAKRYHTTVSKIAGDNALSEAVFSDLSKPLSPHGVTRIIIK